MALLLSMRLLVELLGQFSRCDGHTDRLALLAPQEARVCVARTVRDDLSPCAAFAQSLKAIENAIATCARANTAAAAQEAQQLLQGGSRDPRKQALQAKRTKKRKRHAVRSRNSYVDAVLNDEEVRSVGTRVQLHFVH